LSINKETNKLQKTWVKAETSVDTENTFSDVIDEEGSVTIPFDIFLGRRILLACDTLLERSSNILSMIDIKDSGF